MSASVMQQFDIFAQLVASGNIATSARILGLPPAGIVEAMNALEDRLGFQIFVMMEGDVELTETGRKLVTALGSMALDAQETWVDGLAPPPPGQSAEPAGRPLADEQPDATHAALPAPTIIGVAPHQPDPDETPDIAIEPADPEEEEEVTPRHFVPHRPRREPAPRAAESVRAITLASHPAIFSHFQEALVAFEEASPDIGITMRLAGIGATEVAELFAQKLADIAYFYALEEPTGLASRYAWSERISLFVGEGHPLAKKDSPLAEDMAATPYVALAPGNLARTLTEEALARNGLEVGPALFETDNLYEIMKQVQSSPCYFATFGPMARDFGKMPGIVRLAWAQGLPQVQVRQAVREDLADDPAILALAEFLFR